MKKLYIMNREHDAYGKMVYTLSDYEYEGKEVMINYRKFYVVKRTNFYCLIDSGNGRQYIMGMSPSYCIKLMRKRMYDFYKEEFESDTYKQECEIYNDLCHQKYSGELKYDNYRI